MINAFALNPAGSISFDTERRIIYTAPKRGPSGKIVLVCVGQ